MPIYFFSKNPKLHNSSIYLLSRETSYCYDVINFFLVFSVVPILEMSATKLISR